MRLSPPEEARALAGPIWSTSSTRLPARRRCSAVQAPNTPAPTTTRRKRALEHPAQRRASAGRQSRSPGDVHGGEYGGEHGRAGKLRFHGGGGAAHRRAGRTAGHGGEDVAEFGFERARLDQRQVSSARSCAWRISPSVHACGACRWRRACRAHGLPPPAAARRDRRARAGGRYQGIVGKARIASASGTISGSAPQMAWPQNETSRGVSSASRPTLQRNHCRFASTSEISATGTRGAAATRVMRLKAQLRRGVEQLVAQQRSQPLQFIRGGRGGQHCPEVAEKSEI